jgi:cardiolipin synthase
VSYVALKLSNIPNLLTVLRMLLVVPIVWLLLQERFGETLILFMIAGATDGIVGLLAKQFSWTSALGGVLDPLADKLLLTGTMLVLGWQGNLPFWLVVMVVLRDVMIVLLAIGYHYLVEPFKAEPILISKINTLMQILLVLSVLFSRGATPLPATITMLLVYCVGLTTLLSGFTYGWKWGRRALQRREQTDAL